MQCMGASLHGWNDTDMGEQVNAWTYMSLCVCVFVFACPCVCARSCVYVLHTGSVYPYVYVQYLYVHGYGCVNSFARFTGMCICTGR